MEQSFDSVFKSIHGDLKKNLEAAEKNTLADSSIPSSLKGSGSIPFSFHLDGTGKYNYSVEQYGAGKTVHIIAIITDPDAVYSITVQSSDGGGGSWSGVKPGQELNCNINTSFWHKTKISVSIQANVTNMDGHGKINYSY